MHLKDKIAIVTGGSRGIGKEICLKFASLGANLVINYIGDKTQAEDTKAECEKLGAKVALSEGDVSKMADCEKLFQTAMDTFGRVDILVNNAGITRDNLLMRMSEEEFDAVIAVNLKGTFNCMKQAARPMMKQKYGKIINMASVVGVTGNAGQVNYAASKAGVIGMTKSMAKELANGTLPVVAIPAATPIIFPSAIPQSMWRSGKAFLKVPVLVAAARSASRTTTSSCFFPNSTKALP